jgi:hypothetical protein
MGAQDTQRDQLRRIATRQHIARLSDRYFDDAQELATLAVSAGLRTAQVRNLETLAYSTDKVSELLDLLKKLIGRSETDKRWRYQNLGESLLIVLSGLHDDAIAIGEALGEKFSPLPEDWTRQVHLELCREYLKHLSAHYLYSRPEGG